MMLEEIVNKLQAASGSQERSCRGIQGWKEVLTAEFVRETELEDEIRNRAGNRSDSSNSRIMAS